MATKKTNTQYLEEVRGGNKRSFTTLKNRANKGDVEAQCTIGFYYSYNSSYENHVIVKDLEEAVKYFELAGEHADVIDPMINIPIKVLIKNTKEMLVEHYKSLSKEVNPSYQYKLGLCYYNGTGCDVNKTEAFKYLSLAAEQNFEPAVKALNSF